MEEIFKKCKELIQENPQLKEASPDFGIYEETMKVDFHFLCMPELIVLINIANELALEFYFQPMKYSVRLIFSQISSNGTDSQA